MARKYYVVWKGREAGIYEDWDSCKRQVYGFPGARYKSYATSVEAEAAFRDGKPVAVTSPKSGTTGSRNAKATVKTFNATEVDDFAASTKIFTDGGCEPNPGKAGSGLAVYREGALVELWYGLFEPQGTNNTAELNGLISAFKIARSELASAQGIAIFCDSKYSIQCVTQWAEGWARNGWTKKTGEIKNVNLIKEAYALHQEMRDGVNVLHVNGHVGVEGNELADRMSILAIQSRQVDLVRYQDEIDIASILAARSG